MKRYTYHDNSQGGVVAFVTEAENILLADKAYREATGQDVARQAHVGCRIEKVV